MKQVWASQPVHEVAFEIRFATIHVIADAVIGHYQNQLRLMAGCEPDSEAPQLILWTLANPQDPSVLIKVNQLRFAFIERKYNGWEEFKVKAMRYIRAFPLLAHDSHHRYIGLAFRNRLRVANHGDNPLPVEDYISWSLGGPNHLIAKQTRELSWMTDYQLSGPQDILRIEIKNHGEGTTDSDGVENLVVNLDRRINRLDDMGIEEFLDQAHEDIKNAFDAILNPGYRDRLISG